MVKASAKPLPGVIGPVVVDSGTLIALFNGCDGWHARVLAWLRSNGQVRLVSTWPVATEV